MSNRYKKRTEHVNAIRFTRTNHIEIINLCGKVKVMKFAGLNGDPVLNIERNWGNQRAELGDWIVREKDGLITVLNNVTFNSLYETA